MDMQLLLRPVKRLKPSVDNLFGDQEELAQNRRNIVFSNYAASAAANLVAGNFLTGFLILMNAEDAFIGLVTMAAFLANILQVLSPLLLERFEKRKKILIYGRAALYVMNIGIISIIPYLPYENKIKLAAVLAIIMLINFINALLLPGYSVWHIKSIPEKVRTSYFSFFTVSNGIFIFSLLFGAGKLVDHFKTAGNELGGLMLIRGFALLMGVVDIFFLTRIKEYNNEGSNNRINLTSVIVGPFREKKYLLTVLIACMWSFSANIVGPYFNIYLLKDLNVEYSFLNLVGMMQLITLTLLTPFWARRIGKTSSFQTLTLCMGFTALHFIGLIFVTKSSIFIFPLSVLIFYIFAPGIGLVMSNIPFINIPPQNQTNFIGFFSAMNNLAALTGGMIGNLFIRFTGSINIHFFGMTLQNRQYIVLLGLVIMLCATVVVQILSKKVSRMEG